MGLVNQIMCRDKVVLLFLFVQLLMILKSIAQSLTTGLGHGAVLIC